MGKAPEYKFLESICELNENCPIKIMDGQFKDIVFKYGKISINETPEQELSVNMDITVITAPENFDQNTPEFTNEVGEIFVDIIEKDAAITKQSEEPIDLEDDVHAD
jgi:hypothetical protein